VADLTPPENALYAHLVETLMYFLRQHAFRTKTFLQVNELNARVAQLFKSPEKYLQLTALKYFRTCLAMNDPWHHQQMIEIRVMEPILHILVESMPRDNLLNSACLDFFEFLRRVSFTS
jgi:protein phosphatase-4 regulatory subunit 3